MKTWILGMPSFFAFQSANKNKGANIAPTKKFDGNPPPFFGWFSVAPVICLGPFGAGPFLSGRLVWILVRQEKDRYFHRSVILFAEHFFGFQKWRCIDSVKFWICFFWGAVEGAGRTSLEMVLNQGLNLVVFWISRMDGSSI